MRKLTCPLAAGSGTDHFSDADYKTKDVCDATTVTDGERQDVMLGQSLRHRSILDRFFRIWLCIYRLFFDKGTADIRGQSDA